MVYTKQVWENEPSTNTALEADRLNFMEAGIEGAYLGFTPENSSNKGAANGYCPLNAMQQVPSENLPSYVDDVLEFELKTSFPSTGEKGKIYVDTTTNLTWRWAGSTYIEISKSPGSSDEVAEGITNLYFTNARAQAALATALSTKADKTVAINTGTGLSGGGDLTANRTLSVQFGSTVGTACQGNDARLSDARVPTSHTHSAADINSGKLDIAQIPTGTSSSTVCVGNDSRIVGAVQSSDLDTAVSDLMPTDFTSATATAIHNLFAAIWTAGGLNRLNEVPDDILEDLNDSPLGWAYFDGSSDNSPFPSSSGFVFTMVGAGSIDHAVVQIAYQVGGGVAMRLSLDTTSSWPTWTPLVVPGDLATVATSGAYADLTGKPSIPAAVTYGTTAGTACQGNDSRLSNQRTPSDNSVTSAKIVDGAIVNADINASAAIALSKLAAGYVQGVGSGGSAQTMTVRVMASEAAWNALSPKDNNTIYVWTT